MRIVIQRVSGAIVCVGSEVVGTIKQGLFVLVGVCEGDEEKDALFLAGKLSKLRIMADDAGKMNLSVVDSKTEVLAVSQFTLYADTSGGNRPSFIKAAVPELAEKLYKLFVAKLKDLGIEVKTGRFGAYMNIQCDLDGPVTITIDS